MCQPHAIDVTGHQGGLVAALQLQDVFAQEIGGCVEFDRSGSKAADSGHFQENPD
jgi:hypothetical protein